MTTSFESTFAIHDQGVTQVAAEFIKNGYRQVSIPEEPVSLMDREFIIKKQRRIKPETGLMPHDIVAGIEGHQAVLKIFATGVDGEHSSLWRAPGYLLEATRIYPLFIGVVTDVSTRRMLQVFGTTHRMLQLIGKSNRGGVAALVQTQDLFNGTLQQLIANGGGICNPEGAKA